MRLAIPFLCLMLSLGACAPAAAVVAISPRLLPPDLSLGPDVHLSVGERAPGGVLHRWNLADTAALPAPNRITRTGIYTTAATLADSIRHLHVSSRCFWSSGLTLTTHGDVFEEATGAWGERAPR